MVKSLLLSLLLMLSFLGGAFAESSCLCLEDLEAHATDMSHDQGGEEHERDSGSGHCTHICTQCHFVALEVPKLMLESSFQSFRVSFFFPAEDARSIASLLYRPPIS